jgi:hypothetical protein
VLRLKLDSVVYPSNSLEIGGAILKYLVHVGDRHRFKIVALRQNKTRTELAEDEEVYVGRMWEHYKTLNDQCLKPTTFMLSMQTPYMTSTNFA